MLLDITNCLDELDKVMYEKVDIGYIANTLEDIREFIELNYDEQKDKIYAFQTINHLYKHIKKDYIKKNDLNYYNLLRKLVLKCHWQSLNISTLTNKAF